MKLQLSSPNLALSALSGSFIYGTTIRGKHLQGSKGLTLQYTGTETRGKGSVVSPCATVTNIQMKQGNIQLGVFVVIVALRETRGSRLMEGLEVICCGAGC